jgi:membrane-associated HD superfamily phosphohydrolase
MVVALPILVTVTLLTAVPVFADGPSGAQAAAMGIAFLFMFVVFLAAYVYMSLALQTIAKKTNTENAWLAWIPIANIILMLNVGKKPLWWIILFFIPLVNFVMIVLTFMAIAEAVKKPNWWGILMIVPVVNLIVPGYLAWAD